MAQGDDAREQMIQVPPRVLVELIATMTAAPPNTGTVKVRSAGPKPPADDFWRARECGTQTRLRRPSSNYFWRVRECGTETRLRRSARLEQSAGNNIFQGPALEDCTLLLQMGPKF